VVFCNAGTILRRGDICPVSAAILKGPANIWVVGVLGFFMHFYSQWFLFRLFLYFRVSHWNWFDCNQSNYLSWCGTCTIVFL